MTSELRVSIGQIKRDVSELVNRVAYAGERIILTSRGKPKAVLISLDDYELLTRMKGSSIDAWQTWLAENARLNQDILERSGGPLDVDAIWRAARADLEERDAAAGA